MAEERETYMPLAELNTPAKQSLPKVKPELARVGARVVAWHKGIQRMGTISYVANFTATIRPDDGRDAFNVSLKDVLRKAPPPGHQGYRGKVKFSHKTLGRKVTFTLDAELTAPDWDEAYKRMADGLRRMFPASSERRVYDIRLDPSVVE